MPFFEYLKRAVLEAGICNRSVGASREDIGPDNSQLPQGICFYPGAEGLILDMFHDVGLRMRVWNIMSAVAMLHLRERNL